MIASYKRRTYITNSFTIWFNITKPIWNRSFKSKTFTLTGIYSNNKNKQIEACARTKDSDPLVLIGHLRHAMHASNGNDERKELEYISIDDIHHTKFRFDGTIRFQSPQKLHLEQVLQTKDTDCASYVFFFVFVHVCLTHTDIVNMQCEYDMCDHAHSSDSQLLSQRWSAVLACKLKQPSFMNQLVYST